MKLTDMKPTSILNPAQITVEFKGEKYEITSHQPIDLERNREWDIVLISGKTRTSFGYVMQRFTHAFTFAVHPWHHYIPMIGTTGNDDHENVIGMILKYHRQRDAVYKHEAASLRGFPALEWAVNNAPYKHGFRRNAKSERFTIPVYDAIPRVLVTLRYETEPRSIRSHDPETGRRTKEVLTFEEGGKYTVQVRDPEYHDDDVRLFDDPRDAVLSAIEASKSAYT